MDEDKKVSRRTALRSICGLAGFATAGSIVMSPVIDMIISFNDYETEEPIDSSPVTRQVNYSNKKRDYLNRRFKPIEIERPIGSYSGLLYGVAHARFFAERHFERIEDLVSNCSMVVSEAEPAEITSRRLSPNAQAFFGTVTELCKKHYKPVICLDSDSATGMAVECLAGAGSLTLTAGCSLQMFKPRRSRRSFLWEAGGAALGAYLSMGSLFSNGFKKTISRAVTIFSDDESKPSRVRFENEKYLLSHIVDQRNIQLTERLLSLPKLLPPEDFSTGKYVLVIYGNAHIIGLDYYLSHPFARKLKSGIYSFTYDVLDSDAIIKYIPNGKGWDKIVLKS